MKKIQLRKEAKREFIKEKKKKVGLLNPANAYMFGYKKGYKKAKEQDREEILEDLCELLNNINDDLEMDKTGEQGYKTHKEVVNAIKEYTLKVLKKKIKKWENSKKEHP